MEVFFILWGLVGFISALILTYNDYCDGKDITLAHVFATIIFTIFGFLFIIPIITISNEIILIKRKKK